MRNLARKLIFLASLGVLSLVGGPASATDCNPDALCTGDPCIITGTHRFTDDVCELGFGDRQVILAKAAGLLPKRGSEFRLDAGTITIQGLISGIGIKAYLASSNGDFHAAPGSKISLPTYSQSYGYGYAYPISSVLYIDSPGAIRLEASVVEAHGGGMYLTGGSILVKSKLAANPSEGESEAVILQSLVGDIILEGSVRSDAGRGASYGWGWLDAYSARDIIVRGKVRTGAGIRLIAGQDVIVEDRMSIIPPSSRYTFAAYATLMAERDVVLRTKLQILSKTPDGTNLDIIAGRNALLDADILAKPKGGLYGSAAYLYLSALENLTVNRKVTVSASGETSSNTELSACSINFNGTLSTKANGGAAHLIQYGNQLTLGPNAKAGNRSGANAIECPCIDNEPDGICDGGCQMTPIGLNEASFSPAATLSPVPMTACP